MSGFEVPLLIAGTAMTAVSTISAARQQASAHRYQAELSRQAAEQERQLAAREAEDYRHKQRKLLATARARRAGAGISLTGTPLLTSEEMFREMELGVGIHGEPGRKRVKLASADAIAAAMVAAIADDLADGGDALLLVNGFGGTPLMELYLMYHSARASLEKRGIKVQRSLVGNYVTSLDMAGCSITVSLMDQQALDLWDAPAHTPAFRKNR